MIKCQGNYEEAPKQYIFLTIYW